MADEHQSDGPHHTTVPVIDPGLTFASVTDKISSIVLKRKTQGKRLTNKLKSLREQARFRMHTPVSEQHRWVCQVLQGHYAYYGLPSNFPALYAFYQQVRLLWFRSLRRRSQRRLTWQGYSALLQRLSLPTPHITHPCEERRA